MHFTEDILKKILRSENEIVFAMLSDNRNLLGPHHRPSGESYSVVSDTFSNKICWSDDLKLPPWSDDYNFAVFGAQV